MDLASFMWPHKHGKTHSIGMYGQSVAQIFQNHKHSLISSLYLLLIYHLPPLDDAQVVHMQAGIKGRLFSGQGILHLFMFFLGITHGGRQSRLLQVEKFNTEIFTTFSLRMSPPHVCLHRKLSYFWYSEDTL